MDNILKFAPTLLDGLLMTVQIGLSALVVGILLGLLGAAGKLSKARFLPGFTYGVTNVFRGVPELVIIYIIYYDLPKLLSWITDGSVSLNPYGAGTIALALVFGAYASETFRGAFLAVPAGQLEAARAYGMSRSLAFRRIHLPQMWRFALPGLANLWVVLIKDTSLVSLIGLEELMRSAVIAQRNTREPFTFYSLAGLIYILLTLVSSGIGHYLEKRAQRGVRMA
jgi:polar amino acid transport system permease protein